MWSLSYLILILKNKKPSTWILVSQSGYNWTSQRSLQGIDLREMGGVCFVKPRPFGQFTCDKTGLVLLICDKKKFRLITFQDFLKGFPLSKCSLWGSVKMDLWYTSHGFVKHLVSQIHGWDSIWDVTLGQTVFCLVCSLTRCWAQLCSGHCKKSSKHLFGLVEAPSPQASSTSCLKILTN